LPHFDDQSPTQELSKIIGISTKNQFQLSSVINNSLKVIINESAPNTIHSFTIDSQGKLFIAFGNSSSVEIYQYVNESAVKILSYQVYHRPTFFSFIFSDVLLIIFSSNSTCCALPLDQSNASTFPFDYKGIFCDGGNRLAIFSGTGLTSISLISFDVQINNLKVKQKYEDIIKLCKSAIQKESSLHLDYLQIQIKEN
jgi:hypothetical protein